MKGDPLTEHGVPKEYRPLAAEALACGFTIVMTGGNHLQWRSPDGRDVVHTALSPSDWRALKNDRARLERIGLPKKSQLSSDQGKRKSRSRADQGKRARSR